MKAMTFRVPAALLVCIVYGLAGVPAAHAQYASTCLRPLAIPDKWVEQQTPPFDGPDTYDPPADFYVSAYGYNPEEDDGRFLALKGGPTLRGNSYFPVQLGEIAGADAFRNNLDACVGIPYRVGDVLEPEFGSLLGVTADRIAELIARDPNARWDSTTNRVVDSAFSHSPRVIALPVFDPEEYEQGLRIGKPVFRIVRIVGFFVAGLANNTTIQGYLTAYATITAFPSSVRLGQAATLSTFVETPGGGGTDVPVEFSLFDEPVWQTLTGPNGGAWVSEIPVSPLQPGVYPGAVRAALGYRPGFLRADASTADLTVERGVPDVVWPTPAPIYYGTALGPGHLGATASVPGQFLYSPPTGTVLHAGSHVLNVTFVPDDRTSYDEVTASVVVSVQPSPLMVSVASTSKLYLDPLPLFAMITSGFVNGDTASSLSGAAAFQTAATVASPAGAYPVHLTGLSSPDYAIQYQPGTLSILPRGTSISIASDVNPAAYGQSVRIAASVNSTLGTPTGSVELFVGATSYGARLLVSGNAAFDVPALPPGTHTFQARYLASINYVGSLSAPLHQIVERAASTAALTVSPSPSTYGQVVTLTVRVTSPLGLPPTGSVEFREGAAVFATATLSPQGDAAVATLTSTTFAAGTHQISAAYAGSSVLQLSSAPPQSFSVARSATEITLTTSPNPSRVGEAITLRATVSAVAPGGGTPTGVVEFYAGTTRIGTATPVNGSGTLLVSSLKAGKYQMQARYLMTQNYAASVSPGLLHTVRGGK
jgi:hypothetical protein